MSSGSNIISASEIVKYKSYTKYNNLKCPYENTPFKMYKNLSSKRKGAAFEKIFEEHMLSRSYKMVKNHSSDHDRIFIVNQKEVKFEVKGSMLWGETGTTFKFQQIRVDQDYDQLIFLCVYPDSIRFYTSPKEEVTKYVDVQNDKGEWPFNQHGGKRVRSGTFAIQGLPSDFPFMEELDL